MFCSVWGSRIPWNRSYYSCHVSPLEEQPALLIAESSLQPLDSLPFKGWLILHCLCLRDTLSTHLWVGPWVVATLSVVYKAGVTRSAHMSLTSPTVISFVYFWVSKPLKKKKRLLAINTSVQSSMCRLLTSYNKSCLFRTCPLQSTYRN